MDLVCTLRSACRITYLTTIVRRDIEAETIRRHKTRSHGQLQQRTDVHYMPPIDWWRIDCICVDPILSDVETTGLRLWRIQCFLNTATWILCASNLVENVYLVFSLHSQSHATHPGQKLFAISEDTALGQHRRFERR